MSQSNRHDRPLKFAACAVAVVAAVGGSALASASETNTINQIERYCTVSWRNAGIAQQDWSGCTQQALQELLERVSRNQLQVAMQNNESRERQELNAPSGAPSSAGNGPQDRPNWKSRMFVAPAIRGRMHGTKS